MKPNFVPHPYLAGEGRCRVCNLPYSKMIAKEVAVHRRFHGDYLRACAVGGAPMPETVRDAQARAGLAPQFAEGVSFKERLAGAEKWLEAVFHGYLFGALYHQVEHLMDLREYFTKRVEGRGRLGLFQPDVAAALRFRYSDNFIG